ncbi:MAG: hypothetical protein ABEN55_18695, partial [Bradymonadaceae bacterium]
MPGERQDLVLEQELEELLPLSPVQKGILYESLAGVGNYVLQYSFELADIDFDVFREAWRELLNRHAALRAGILIEGLDEPIQLIHCPQAVSIP